MKTETVLEIVNDVRKEYCCCADGEKCQACEIAEDILAGINDNIDGHPYCLCGNRLSTEDQQIKGYCWECV